MQGSFRKGQERPLQGLCYLGKRLDKTKRQIPAQLIKHTIASRAISEA